MSSRFYTSNVAPPYTPATFKGAWDKTTNAVTMKLVTDSYSAGFSTNFSSSKSTATADYDICVYRGVSAPLAAQTIAGTLSLIAGIVESTAAMDAVYHVHVWVTQGDSDTVRGTLLADAIDSIANEFSTNTVGGAKAWSGITLSSVAVSAGDRLVVEIGASSLAAPTGSVTFRHGSFGTNTDMVAGSDISSSTVGWVEFSQTLTFLPVTRFYLNNRVAPYTPATLKGAWDHTSSAVTKLLHFDKLQGGTIGNVNVSKAVATADYDILTYRGVSMPLAAQTIAGKLSGVLGPYESAASMDAVYHLHFYVTQGDSDLVRGTLLNDYVETLANELSFGVNSIPMIPATLTSVAVSAGDRLVLEVGARTIAALSGGNISHYYGGGTTFADNGGTGDNPNNTAQWIEFDSAVTLVPVDARVSQVLMEGALEQNTAQDARVSHILMEAAFTLTASQDARVAQIMMEVAVQDYSATPTAVGRNQIVIVG